MTVVTRVGDYPSGKTGNDRNTVPRGSMGLGVPAALR
jgi:hypothetical protein